MKWMKSVCLAMLATLGISSAQPVYEWTCDTWKGEKTPATRGNVQMYGAPAEKQGVGQSGAIYCGDKIRNQLAYFNLDWASFSVDFQF